MRRNSNSIVKNFYRFILAWLFLIPQIIAQNTAPSGKKTYAFTMVDVIPMESEQVLEDQTVLTSNGRITAIGPTAAMTFPEDVQVIDGKGKYLMPGLTEMHGHIPGGDRPQYGQDVLFLYISNGVTTVRNMLGSEYHLRLRQRLENEELPGPTIFAASPWLSEEHIPDAEAADRVVRRYKEAGFDLLKMGNLPPGTYRSVAETAHRINIPFGGHIPEAVGLEMALEARQKSIDHYDRYVEFLVPEDANTENRSNGFFGSGIIDLIDRDRIPLAIQLTLEADTWNIPTLSLIEHLASEEPAEEMIKRPEMRYMPKDVLQDWVNYKNNYKQREDFRPGATARLVSLRRDLTRELYRAGAPLALGSDAPQFFNVPGFSIHHEMQMMVASGLSPYEVLTTGTRNAAEYFGTPGEFGTIQTGSRADLILLNSNPLQDISNVQDRAGVMVRGAWWTEEQIRERLEEIAARNGGN